MSRFLITGIAGFIGSNLARALLKRGEHVVGVDNFVTGSRANVSELLRQIDFHECDLNETGAVQVICHNVDYVLHQAAIPSVPRSIEDPRGSHENNINTTVNVLLAAREAGVKRVVYAASSAAYGDTSLLPKHEEMLPNPISPYAVGKLTGELYMQCFWRVYGLETVSLRYFNVFGPHQDANSEYSGVLAKFITLMLRGQCPTILGDGNQSRDFTYIDDIVQANLLACHAPRQEVAGKVLNIATGRSVTLNEIYTVLQELTGFSDEAQYGTKRAGDIVHSLADISRARRHLGYKPCVDLEEGLRRTVEWYRTREADPRSPVGTKP